LRVSLLLRHCTQSFEPRTDSFARTVFIRLYVTTYNFFSEFRAYIFFFTLSKGQWSSTFFVKSPPSRHFA